MTGGSSSDRKKEERRGERGGDLEIRGRRGLGEEGRGGIVRRRGGKLIGSRNSWRMRSVVK